MKNRKDIHKAWKVGLLGVTACFLLGGCSITKATDAEQGGNNKVIATSAENLVDVVKTSGNEEASNAENVGDVANTTTNEGAENAGNEVNKADIKTVEKETASTGNSENTNQNTTASAGTNVKTSTTTSNQKTSDTNGQSISGQTTTNTNATNATTTTTTASATENTGRVIGGGLLDHVSTETSKNSFLPLISMETCSDPVYKGNTTDDRMILMDIKYPVLADYSDNSGSIFYTILNQVNNGCLEGVRDYRSNFESMARDEYNEKTNWEDGAYFYFSEGYLRRVDEKVFSMVEFIETYANGAHPSHYYNSYNYDMTTGAKITLSNLVTDKEALYNAIKKALLEKYDESVFLDDTTLTTTLHNYVCDPSYGEMNFTIEKDGVSFWFSNYDLAAYSEGRQMVTIPFKGNEGLFQKEYVTTDEDSVKMVVPEVAYKLSSGHTLEIYDGYNENGYVNYMINYDNTLYSVEEFGGYDTQKTYLVHKNGKDYLYCQANGYSDDDCLLIYSLGGASLGTAKYPAENVKLLCPMIDLNNVRMYLRTDVLSTMQIEKIFRIGDDGMPVSDSAFYELGDCGQELTLLQDLKFEVAKDEKADLFVEEVIPAGTKMKIFRTNGNNLIDLKLQDGRIARLSVELDPEYYSCTINGKFPEEFFSGMVYYD